MTEGPYLWRRKGNDTWRVVEIMKLHIGWVFFLPGVSYSHRATEEDEFVRLIPERELPV